MTIEEFKLAGYNIIENIEIPQFNSLRELQDYIRNNNLDCTDNPENIATISKFLLQTLMTLPADDKVNGYGLNFIGRNIARAKYAQKTDKELKLNAEMSKEIDTTRNLLIKGDNLDSLKILKSYYTAKIKCIYIDPPYNTASDEFIYPDKFNKEEAEVLGLANLSDSDIERMEFSFKSKKSHNGWLAFIYPRLLLARDLLTKDGVIFISIDDNEQANLKILCDEIFGEENFVACVSWHKNYSSANDSKVFSNVLDYILVYSKSQHFKRNLLPRTNKQNQLYKYDSKDGKGLWRSDNLSVRTYSANYDYPITNPNTGIEYYPPKGRSWMTNLNTIQNWIKEHRIFFGQDGKGAPQLKRYLNEVQDGVVPISYWSYEECGHNDEARKEIKELFGDPPFDSPKPTRLIKQILNIGTNDNDIILDFFAGSGTTGQAVMQLNAEDGGNRRFILCQIDEPIKDNKSAYKFCIANNLPPVISSITIERLKRAGEKIKLEIESENEKNELFDDLKKQVPDIGIKVFDSIEAPKLVLEGEQIEIKYSDSDAISRIYNMIFKVGTDCPANTPEEIVKDCIYRLNNNYYITNAENISHDELTDAIRNGNVYIDGWTASINGTLQTYKDAVKIIF